MEQYAEHLIFITFFFLILGTEATLVLFNLYEIAWLFLQNL